jgi:hypothetical protein
MGVTRRLTALATRRPHVLLVEVPGSWSTRVVAERAVARLGWPLALSPADADALVLCGRPGDRLAGAVERVWHQLPGPRARVALPEHGTEEEITTALSEIAARLADDDQQRADTRDRPNPVSEPDPDDADEGMAPDGIPLAGGGHDRDGLEMDVLHVPLGPILPDWPPGLVLRCALHGDVVSTVEVEVLPGSTGPPEQPEPDAAIACDAAARLLAVAGWAGSADTARQFRDLVLDDPDDRGPALEQLDRFRSRIVHSWSLRWLMRGVGSVDGELCARYGLPAGVAGDVHDRLVAMLARAELGLRGGDPEPAPEVTAVLDVLPRIVTGLDLAAVRLVVASFGPTLAGCAGSAPDRA